MNRWALVLGFLIISFQAFAAEKPDSWLCDMKDSLRPWPQPDQVAISLKKPIVTEIQYILGDDGTYTSKQKPLINETLVSEWGFDKSKCAIKGGFNQGTWVDTYDFIFNCPGVRGSFSMDFNQHTGSFYEELSQGVHRAISLENCRSN